MSKVCALVSGGLDSCAMLYELSGSFDEVHPLYIKFGLYWEKAELYWLNKFLSSVKNNSLKKLKILEIRAKDMYDEHWSVTGKNIPDEQSSDDKVYIPGRNILLLSVASVFCEKFDINSIGIGVLKSNPFKDASDKFFNAMEKALSIGLNRKIKVVTPFSDNTKNKLIVKYNNLPLELTFSCINPIENKHCGKCNKCHERKMYFKKANVKDETSYVK